MRRIKTSSVTKLKKLFIETRLSDRFVDDSNMQNFDIYQKFLDNNLVQHFDDKTEILMYKTKNKKDSVSINILFIFDLSDKITKNSNITNSAVIEQGSQLMYIIDLVESTFQVLDKKYQREFVSIKKGDKEIKKLIGLLKVECSQLLLEEQSRARQYIIF